MNEAKILDAEERMAEENPAGGAARSPEWMTVEQVAEWLQVSTKTIRRYIEDGSLPAVNLGGRAIRIRRQDLEVWLQNRRVEPGASLHRQEQHERREQRRQEHLERREQRRQRKIQ
jgi:excisionase family DNA binding protein